jgi:hypothetical protein
MRVGLHVFVFVINPILMNGPRKRPPSPLEPTTLTLLEAVRVQLLRLHKVLLDDERAAYERLRGPMGTPGQVLSLVMSDPFFDWLHSISRLIIQFDELSESPEGTEAEAAALVAQARDLVLARVDETDFSRKYKAALQRNSAAVMAHAEVLKVLRDD